VCRDVYQNRKYLTTIPCAADAPYVYQDEPYVTPFGWFRAVWTREGFAYYVLQADGREYYTWLLPIAVHAIRDGWMQPKDEEFCYSPQMWVTLYGPK
jgi:hypothetical protein